MFRWLRNKLLAFIDRQRLARQIEPEAFRTLTGEMRELARLAERLWPPAHKEYERIKKIQQDMDRMEAMAERPEFKQLSPRKRLLLKQNLIKSRHELLETVRSAPSPTTTLQ